MALSEAAVAPGVADEVSRSATAALELDDPRWRAFVDSHPEALVFHRPEWIRAVSASYGWNAFVLARVGEGGALDAGIPVISVRDLRRRERWVSLPFSDLCPPLIGEYGSVVFISGNMPFRTEIAPLLIMTKLEQFDYAGATAIALVMLVASAALLLTANALQWRRRRTA